MKIITRKKSNENVTIVLRANGHREKEKKWSMKNKMEWEVIEFTEWNFN